MQPLHPDSENQNQEEETPKHIAPDFNSNKNTSPEIARASLNKSLTPIPNQSGGDDNEEIHKDQSKDKDTFQEFLNKQGDFVKEKQMHIENAYKSIKDIEDKKMTSIPTIDNYSKMLASKNDITLPTYERLSKLNRNKLENVQVSPEGHSKKAYGPPKCFYASKKQVAAYKPKKQACPLKSTKTNIISKFKKEFTDCLSILQINSEQIDTNEFTLILEKLHVISTLDTDKEKQDLWSIISNNSQGIADMNDVFDILCAILFRYEAPDSHLNITEAQAIQLHNKFISFSLNRMNYSKNKSFQTIDNSCSSQNKKSKEFDLNSFLQREKEFMESITERKYSKNDKDLIGCTFAPKIIKNKTKNESASQLQYIDSLSKRSSKIHGKSKNEIEYEKQSHELTFAPLINRSVIKPSKKVNIKGAEDIVQRLRTSYVQKNLTQKQLTLREYNSKAEKQSSSSKIDEPWIYIDVNMGNREERISIYEGDNPDEVAIKFAQQHDLDELTARKLREMIQVNIAKVQKAR